MLEIRSSFQCSCSQLPEFFFSVSASIVTTKRLCRCCFNSWPSERLLRYPSLFSPSLVLLRKMHYSPLTSPQPLCTLKLCNLTVVRGVLDLHFSPRLQEIRYLILFSIGGTFTGFSGRQYPRLKSHLGLFTPSTFWRLYLFVLEKLVSKNDFCSKYF